MARTARRQIISADLEDRGRNLIPWTEGGVEDGP